MNMRTWRLLALSIAVAACNEGSSQSAGSDAAQAAAPATQEEEHAGDTITIKMYTDEKGNYFEPNQIVAKEHDVLRFELVSGVHNVSFPSDQNASAGGLPAPSEMLQLPGQVLFIPITWEEGSYAFQCDPHALLGMVGTLTVK